MVFIMGVSKKSGPRKLPNSGALLASLESERAKALAGGGRMAARLQLRDMAVSMNWKSSFWVSS